MKETDPAKLRALAAWYREYADRAGNPAIWEARLRTADKFEAEADYFASERSTVREEGGSPWKQS
jgi:hypothetical protein